MNPHIWKCLIKLTFCRTILCISTAYAVMRCLSVCLSVTFVDHVITNTYLQNFSPSGSHTILVYRYQTRWRYSDGNPTPLTGASNARVVGRNEILDEYLASLHTGLQCCQLYEWQSVKTAATNGSKRRALTATSVVRCSHKTTTKCLWRARRYTPETKGGQTPLGYNPHHFLLP